MCSAEVSAAPMLVTEHLTLLANCTEKDKNKHTRDCILSTGLVLVCWLLLVSTLSYLLLSQETPELVPEIWQELVFCKASLGMASI